MFKTILFSLALCIMLSAPAYADCDKAQAREDLELVERMLADRTDSYGSVVWYDWRANWNALTQAQKYSLVEGIGGLEKCLTGKAVRIRFGGEDVARYSVTGNVELYD